MKQIITYLTVTLVAILAFVGCDQKNNRSAQIRQPMYGQGYNFNQPYYQNCTNQAYQYTNPMNNTQMHCQYGANGMPQFYNNYMQPYPNDMYGNPCMDMMAAYSGLCSNYGYYPMYNYMY